MDYGYSLEPPRPGDNEYQLSMVWAEKITYFFLSDNF